MRPRRGRERRHSRSSSSETHQPLLPWEAVAKDPQAPPVPERATLQLNQQVLICAVVQKCVLGSRGTAEFTATVLIRFKMTEFEIFHRTGFLGRQAGGFHNVFLFFSKASYKITQCLTQSSKELPKPIPEKLAGLKLPASQATEPEAHT